VPVIAGSLSLLHDDLDSDGDMDPGEPLHAAVVLQESGGCDASAVEVALVVDPDLGVDAVFDGGSLAGATIAWTVAAVPALGSATVAADLSLGPSAPNCALPRLDASATYPRSPGTACVESESWSAPDVPTPPGHCVPLGPVDLLREGAVTSLGPPVAPAVSSLLDAAGQHDTCRGGVTRIPADASHVVAADVAALLAAGIAVPGDAIAVGGGTPGVLVFYEVSASCATIRACKVDGDGNASNGREDVLIREGSCPP
jgi:hypothetical protein